MIGASTPSAQDVETYVKKHQVDILREYLGLVAIPDVQTDLPNIRKNAEYLRGGSNVAISIPRSWSLQRETLNDIEFAAFRRVAFTCVVASQLRPTVHEDGPGGSLPARGRGRNTNGRLSSRRSLNLRLQVLGTRNHVPAAIGDDIPQNVRALCTVSSGRRRLYMGDLLADFRSSPEMRDVIEKPVSGDLL